MRARALLSGVATLALACTGSDHEQAPGSASFAAPPSLRATLVLEPSSLEIGEVTVVELAVVTPKEHHVLPVAPVELPGLWLLGVRSLPVSETEDRLVHRTEFRVRPRELGTHTWPEMKVRVELPEGTSETLVLAPREFEVTSVRNRFADRDEPFGIESLETAPAPSGGFGAGVATGIGLSALALLVALALRRAAADRADRAAARALASRAQPKTSLGEWSTREIENALEMVDDDPRAAANAGAQLLRVFVARRYGAGTEAATTEELARRTPTLTLRSLWPDLVGILNSFDDVRFRPNGDGSERRRRTRRALDDTRQLIEAASPARGRERSANARARDAT